MDIILTKTLINTILHNVPHNLQIKFNRGQIFTGFKCSQYCKFCYYNHIKNKINFNDNDVYRQIDLEIKSGSTIFEIMGGEPGECNQLLNYVKYIKNINSNFKINVVTNGSIIDIPEVLDFIDIITLSYHLSKDNNMLTAKYVFPYGSTYNKAYKLAQLCHNKNIFLKTNTVFGYYNIDDIINITKDLIIFKPALINFQPVDLSNNNELNIKNYYSYDQLINFLKLAIDNIKYSLPNTLVFIKYIPFCKMDKYESHIIGFIQRFYDQFDFSKELSTEYIQQLLQLPDNDILNYFNIRNNLKYRLLLNTNYIKIDKCNKCKYYYICNGFDPQFYNAQAIQPIIDKKILNPMIFINYKIQTLFKSI